MGLIDWIRNLFGNGKKNPLFISKTLTKTYGEPEPLEVGLYDGKTPLTNRTIDIKINGVKYERTTDNNGIAKLNINLNPGEYTAFINYNGDDEYNSNNGYTVVEVLPVKKDTRMEGTDINMTYRDGTVYQCAVYGPDNERVFDTVDLTVNGVKYNKTPDTNGLYKLNINLDAGNYTITSVFKGNNEYASSSVINSININKAPEPPAPTPTPTKLYPYLTSQGGGKLGQRTGYTCGPHSLMQCIYRLTGVELSDMALASVCGTTTSGTGHSGLETGLAWFNRQYGYNLKMTWKNFSEVGFDGLQKAYENGAVFCHLLYRNRYGHYEVPLTSNSNPMKILNSLGDSCGGGYCGYIESRSQSTQQSYINGISQKSICIITR